MSLPKTNFDVFSPENWRSYKTQTSLSGRPVSADDLVDGSGRCGGQVQVAATDADGNGAPVAAAGSGASVGLEMTECEVVRASGPPQSVEVGANERGERSVVMTYATVERSGIYRFVGGRLTSIERGPDLAPPPKPAKKPAKKKPA